MGSNFILNGCKATTRESNTLFDEDQIRLLDEIGEAIIPATDTPGAKAAQVGSFMALMVKDGYDSKHQEVFINGIRKLNEVCKKQYREEFMQCDSKKRKEILEHLDQEQREYMANKKSEEPSHYFRMMKELTLIGFFTSETGATKTLRYIAVPGKYEGDVPYKKGDRAWATS